MGKPAPMSPPVLAIVGRSGSGKTTLLEKLLAVLVAQGLHVSTIKHSHHQPELDTPGKDSWRHKQAGAQGTLLIGPQQMMLVRDAEDESSPQALARTYFSDADLVLVEGFAAMPGAKIEVVRAARSQSLCCAETELLAVATDIRDLRVSVPRLDLNDAEAIATYIRQWIREGWHGQEISRH